MIYRRVTNNDLNGLKELALKSWRQFQSEMTNENWLKLSTGLANDNTYKELIEKFYGWVGVNDHNEIVGMSFLVPSGNPTEIYDSKWSYIRLVTVDPDYGGKGIGRQLTEMCIEQAKENKETIVALHTSEMMNKARHIYESMGFTILKEIEPRLGKRYWLYTLAIN